MVAARRERRAKRGFGSGMMMAMILRSGGKRLECMGEIRGAILIVIKTEISHLSF